jgi:hypothetical protein
MLACTLPTLMGYWKSEYGVSYACEYVCKFLATLTIRNPCAVFISCFQIKEEMQSTHLLNAPLICHRCVGNAGGGCYDPEGCEDTGKHGQYEETMQPCVRLCLCHVIFTVIARTHGDTRFFCRHTHKDAGQWPAILLSLLFP